MIRTRNSDSDDANQLRALIVGLGSIGQRHARNLRSLLGDRVSLSAYRVQRSAPVLSDDLRADHGQRPEDVYGIQTYDSLDHALDQRPQVAWICNPTVHHLDAAMKCLAAGCDVFLEKPISDSMRGVDRLAALAEEQGAIVGVSSQLRFHPALQRLRSVLQAGQMGRPLAVRAEVGEYLPGFHPYEDYRTSYASQRSLGGGVVLTLIHDIDYLVWLFGAPRRLFSVGGKLSSLELDVEDVASTLMECGDADTTVPVHLQMDYVRRPARRSCNVLCDKGAADLDLRANCLQIANDRGERLEDMSLDSLERNSLFLAQMVDFLDACRTRRAPSVNLNDGIAAVRVADAVRESMTRGQVVVLA